MKDDVKKNYKLTGKQIDQARLAEILEGMRSWHDLAGEIKGPLPAAVIAAIQSGRGELVLAASGDASPGEKVLLDVIRVLLDTNAALQRHAEEVAKRVHVLEDNLKGLFTTCRRIDDFANFRVEYPDEGEDL